MEPRNQATSPATALTPHRIAKDFGKSQPVHPGSLPSLSSVTNLDFDVTEDCNLGCLYCFKGEMYSRHMSLSTMQRALDWLLAASGASKTVNCNFMGGEPTMRFPAIREFVPWARRRGAQCGKTVTFSMTTNLTLFTDEIRRFVDEHGFGILMSIDGTPEVQDAQRPAKNGKALSSIVEKWARSMLQTRRGSTGRATLHPHFVNHLADSVEYLQSLGFQVVAVSASEYGDWSEKHFAELDGQLRRIERFTLELIEAGVTFSAGAHRFYIDKLIRLRAQGRESEIKENRQPCGAGRGYMMVDYVGDIWPCHRFDGADTAAGMNGQFRFGNIFKDGFDHNLQRAFLDFDHYQDHKESCRTCPVNPVCGGYCPAANLSDTGSIYTPHDTYCRWTQMWYESAERLYRAIESECPGRLSWFLDSIAGAEGTGEK